MKRFRSLLLMLLALVLVLSGCGKVNETKETEVSPESQVSTEQSAEKPAEENQQKKAKLLYIQLAGSKILMARM